MAINLFSKTDNSNVAEQISNNSEEKIIVLTSILDEIKVMRNSLKTMVNLKKDKEQDAIAAAKEEKRSNIGKIDISKQDAEKIKGDSNKKGSNILNTIKNAILMAILSFVPTLIEWVKEIGPKISKLYDDFKLMISDGIEKIAIWWQEKLITPMLDFFMETIPNKFRKITTFFGDAFQSIAWTMGDIGDGIIKWVFETANGVLKKIVSLTDGIPVISNAVKNALGPAIEALDKKISNKQASMDAREQARVDRDKLRAEEAAQGTRDEEVKRKRKEEKESGKVDKSARVPTEGARDDKDKSESRPATKISGMQDVKNMIKRHEGVRYKAYKDSLGLWTIGVGHLIGDGKSQGPYEGKTLTEGEVDALFEEDFAHHYAIAQGTPGWQLANETGKGAMIDLAFNMGKWWTKWPKTSKLLGEGEFESAADEMLDSKWAKQVKGRAITVTDMIRVGGANGSEIDMASMAAKIEVKPQTNKSMTGNQTQIASSQSPIKTPGKKSGGSSKVNAVSLQETYHSRLIQQGNA